MFLLNFVSYLSQIILNKFYANYGYAHINDSEHDE